MLLQAQTTATFGWQAALGDRLLALRSAGAWGYRGGPADNAAAEPTALAVMALASANDRRPQIALAVADGLAWLAQQQRSDGRVGVTEKIDQPGWTTALAALAWQTCSGIKVDQSGAGGGGSTPTDGASTPPGSYSANISAAIDWLLQCRGEPIDTKAAGFAYNTTLIGWPWVRGTNSWLEPTAYAVLALKLRRALPTAPPAELEPRLSEGVRVILDRAIDTGGWNYGNPRALGNGLRPFLDTSGIALTALAGERRCATIDKAIEFVRAELPQVRAPLSLSWGVLGLRAWDAAPPECDVWLAASLADLSDDEQTPVHLAMLLLAAAPRSPFVAAQLAGAA